MKPFFLNCTNLIGDFYFEDDLNRGFTKKYLLTEEVERIAKQINCLDENSVEIFLDNRFIYQLKYTKDGEFLGAGIVCVLIHGDEQIEIYADVEAQFFYTGVNFYCRVVGYWGEEAVQFLVSDEKGMLLNNYLKKNYPCAL